MTRRKIWWPGLALGLAASVIGVLLALSGRPGIGYAVGLVVVGLIVAVAFLLLSLIRPS